MKKTLLILFCAVLFSVSFAHAQSAQEKELIALDMAWEKALLDSDAAFLERLLADDFVWVHNHASLIDGKPQVLARAKRIQGGQVDNTKGRASRDQKVVFLGETAVVSGFTLVDRPPSPVTYNFMRTYAKINGEYKLLANHTMAVPDEELKKE
ncbi:nuclear transport factor 2 family protein [Algoriphagus aestuariicola]|uniref:Nuclear transport factor 2 family protein n=1 Tax=Algoriphagus aestuariicola TaxID=1852016 RepID=A0ABS3BJN7_9BACT|nr:nuclear transport factor 2 family protein [Algoriphagus aestuariicola]MBN7799373.1 nuclear transport factor 2 family protein [Algoriphagus aestuariicola]